jgi:hypothetical protein
MTATRKASKKATAKSTPKQAAKAAPLPEKKARPSVPNAERRNEMTHADGAAAVERFSCEACGAKKGTRCTAKSGEPTNHVHSARMKAFDGRPGA